MGPGPDQGSRQLSYHFSGAKRGENRSGVGKGAREDRKGEERKRMILEIS